VDAEGWKTDPGSRLLARNNGNAAVEGRLTLWGALRVSSRLDFLAIGEAEAGKADPRRTRWDYDLLEARARLTRALTFEGGRILMPMGLFGARRFSNINPVIGAPDMYPAEYPWGAKLSGTAGALDWRAAMISLPVVNVRYTPAPSGQLRPLLGAGINLGPSLHIGASVTHGSYLNRSSPNLPSGTTWDSYKQTIASGDMRFSVGYVDSRAEVAWTSYNAPAASAPLHGLGAYAESKVTLTPRIFIAVRLEHFKYAFIGPFSPVSPYWVSGLTTENNGEVGIGYRLSNALLVKTSVRKDHWPDPATPSFPTPDGYAVALQISWHAYPLDALARVY
jgi:hypothetical protein